MNKKMIWLSALALSMSLSQVTMACGCHEANVTPNKPHEKMIDKLDLTAEQKTKINDIRARAKAEMMPKFKEMHENHKALNELSNEPTLDENKIDKLIENQEKLGGEIAKLRVHTRHEINLILNDKQKMKLHEMKMTWEKNHKTDKDE